MEIELTKEAKGAIAAIYSTYEARRKAGQSKNSATYFSYETTDGRDVCQKAEDSSQELKAAGLIKKDVLGGITLTDRGIIFMENKTANTIKEWLSFLAQFIP